MFVPTTPGCGCRCRFGILGDADAPRPPATLLGLRPVSITGAVVIVLSRDDDDNGEVIGRRLGGGCAIPGGVPITVVVPTFTTVAGVVVVVLLITSDDFDGNILLDIDVDATGDEWGFFFAGIDTLAAVGFAIDLLLLVDDSDGAVFFG